MSTTYLALTNKVIREAGVSLAPLTSGDFATTTDRMQILLKNYTADAWVNIQTDRKFWHFNRKRGVYILQPRIEFYDGNAEEETFFDNITITDTNDNWTYHVNGSVYVESGTFAAGTARGWFNVTDSDELLPISEFIKTSDTVTSPITIITADTYDNLRHSNTFADVFAAGLSVYLEGSATEYGVINSSSSGGGQFVITIAFLSDALGTEFVNLLTLNPSLNIVTNYAGYDPVDTPSDFLTDYLSQASSDATLRILGWGRYRLDTVGPDSDADSAVSDVQEVDLKTFRISPYSGATTDDFSTERQFSEVEFVNPEVWKTQGYGINQQLGCPTHFTIDYDGKYAFYPQPEKAYVLVFDYWKTPQVLSAHGDVVEGIADAYTDVIVWKAVEYWAMYDESSNNVRRAKAMFNPLYRKLLRDYSDNIKFPQGVGGKSFG